ncbi:glycoside hydrolase superfamily [Irpex rosettiformis]|uniref:Glycoside hydrolase superfamily n=1 Tax=Irpex rosettiformis TaxID=378272 RepID=A0ACB8UKI6_9APHY|nr:glycoside hydrolase superfamily [Irpex rosettiformis]
MLLSLASVFMLLAVTLLRAIASQVQPSTVLCGFVTTKGTQFELNGRSFAFVGANSYWLPLLTAQDDVEHTFQSMQAAGIKVLRTWGFNAINGSELSMAKESGLTHYQVWNGTQWMLNEGPQGLQRLDNGMELYINWIAGTNTTHDVFYNDPNIIASYQSYVRTIVERYKDSPNIFAWELMNEARCSGDLPSGPACTPASGAESLLKWYRSQSDFVRSLDPHHLITTGGEGHFFWKNPRTYWFDGELVSDYNWNGQAGEDFDHNLGLPNIDFATYVRLEWIDDHIKAGKMANKPIVLEEFGVNGLDNKTNIYPAWVQYALDARHAIMPWQFGVLNLTESGGNRVIKYADALIDGPLIAVLTGLAIYPNQTTVWDIFTQAAKVQAQRSE